MGLLNPWVGRQTNALFAAFMPGQRLSISLLSHAVDTHARLGFVVIEADVFLGAGRCVGSR